MKGKQRYTLTVRGETVTVEFTRINDSRRVESWYTDKKPNLFHIQAVVLCRMALPKALSPDWHKGENELHPFGAAFCHWSDHFSMAVGRQRALREILKSNWVRREHAGEIWQAYVAAVKARQPKAKVKPKPQPRRPSRLNLLVKTVAQLAEVVNRQSQTTISIPPLTDEEIKQTVRHIEEHPPFRDACPTDEARTYGIGDWVLYQDQRWEIIALGTTIGEQPDGFIDIRSADRLKTRLVYVSDVRPADMTKEQA